ncbi:hypothetical protein L1889_17305 [Paenalcaligenes niemegkensis]|nr:hypothetical protein [Paenalcaligenes niemegkensis]MCQ9618213.1 hypothetical protein [Paenalcaligenes niemegkensis]
MTIGIAASGPHAVSVVMEALRVTETLGAGAIGGFAVLAALDHEGGPIIAKPKLAAQPSFPTRHHGCPMSAPRPFPAAPIGQLH